jgi:hypothetical protein
LGQTSKIVRDGWLEDVERKETFPELDVWVTLIARAENKKQLLKQDYWEFVDVLREVCLHLRCLVLPPPLILPPSHSSVKKTSSKVKLSSLRHRYLENRLYLAKPVVSTDSAIRRAARRRDSALESLRNVARERSGTPLKEEKRKVKGRKKRKGNQKEQDEEEEDITPSFPYSLPNTSHNFMSVPSSPKLSSSFPATSRIRTKRKPQERQKGETILKKVKTEEEVGGTTEDIPLRKEPNPSSLPLFTTQDDIDHLAGIAEGEVTTEEDEEGERLKYESLEVEGEGDADQTVAPSDESITGSPSKRQRLLPIPSATSSPSPVKPKLIRTRTLTSPSSSSSSSPPLLQASFVFQTAPKRSTKLISLSFPSSSSSTVKTSSPSTTNPTTNLASPPPSPSSDPTLQSHAQYLSRLKQFSTVSPQREAPQPSFSSYTNSPLSRSSLTSSSSIRPLLPLPAPSSSLFPSTSPSISTKRPVIITTGLRREMLSRIVLLVERLGGRLVFEFPFSGNEIKGNENEEMVTHLVTLVNNRCAKRTVKYCLGILSRVWVVSFDWILTSFQNVCENFFHDS